VTDQALRLLVDDGPAGLGRGLEPGGDVEDVAARERISGRGVEGDEGIPGGDRGADLEVEPGAVRVQLADRADDPERGPNGALRVVAARERRAEHCQDRVADVLLDGAAVGLDPLPRGVEEPPVHVADVLRVRPVGPSGRADDVDEQDGDELAFLGGHGPEGGPTGGTEPCARSDVGSAARTGHEPS
jgi:hypothetical protein